MNSMNDALVKHYLAMPAIPTDVINSMSVVKADNAHISLLNDSKLSWTYEILGEEYIDDGTSYHVTIALYLPGIIRIGVGKSNTDFNKEHKFYAISKAIRLACNLMRIGVTVNPNYQVKPVTSSQPVNTDTPITQSNNANQQVDYSKEQIDRIKQFKIQYKVEDNDQFMKYVTAWNKDITSKSQLTPFNINGFLDFIDSMEDIALNT